MNTTRFIMCFTEGDGCDGCDGCYVLEKAIGGIVFSFGVLVFWSFWCFGLFGVL